MIDLESAVESQIRHHAFTVTDYYKMAEAGILCENDRVELVQGEIVEMPPIGTPHASVVDRLNWLLMQRLPSKSASIRIQGPVRLDEYNEPVPDVALSRWRDDFYVGSHPTREDVLLIVEVSDSTVIYDQRIKLPLYARHSIQEYWLVNVPDAVIEIYRKPTGEDYASKQIAKRGESISPSAFPDVQLSVDEILG